MCSTKVKDW